MSKAVLDASAVLAYLYREPGCEQVDAVMADSLIGAVNLAEVASKMAYEGGSRPQIEEIIAALDCRIVDFDRALALRTAMLRPLTAKHGLSLGDRSCLALAETEGAPVLTADRAWSKLELGLDVRLIR